MLTLDEVRRKSAPKLIHLHPVVRQATERLIEEAYAQGVPIIITQGYRTAEYQDQLYAQGRNGNPGPIVTNVRGGYSYHNYGLAVDYALLLPDGKSVSWDTARDGDKDGRRDWLEVAAIGKALGFEWGGDWDTFVDMPHLQMTFDLSIQQLRAGKKPPQQALPPEPRYVDIRLHEEKIADGQLFGGVTYAPARIVGQALGVGIGWYSGHVIAGGQALTTKLLNGTGYVPIRELASVAGVRVFWDAQNAVVRLTNQPD